MATRADRSPVPRSRERSASGEKKATGSSLAAAACLRQLSPHEAAQHAFIHRYRATHWRVRPLAIFLSAKRLYTYEVGKNWERRRNAILAAACEELMSVQRVLSAGRARRLIAEKYRGVSLGRGTNCRKMMLRISETSLWRYFSKWRKAKVRSPKIFTSKLSNCGRHPSCAKRTKHRG